MMEFADYQKVDAVNASSLKTILSHSPRHYLYALQHPKPATPAMLLGIATHTAVLEPDRFQAEYIRKPDGLKFTTSDGKAWRDEQIGAGLLILDGDDYDQILSMRKSLMQNPRIRELLTAPGAVEKSIRWIDDATGLACKGRPDLVLDDGTLIDLKTTRDVRPRQFTQAVMNFDYPLSMSFYADGLRKNGIDVRGVYLIAVETAAPYDCAPYRLPAEMLDYGRDRYGAGLAMIKTCRETDSWPGIVTGDRKSVV